MKITVRLPTEQYAYIEVEFESVKEYTEEYPKFCVAVKETRQQAKDLITNS